MIAHLEPLQQRYSAIMEDDGYLDSVLARGAGKSLGPLGAVPQVPAKCVKLQVVTLYLMGSLLADKAEEAATRTLDNVREVSSNASMIAVCG